MQIPKIVLSGGPGGGKSTALNRLSVELSNLGYKVYKVVESATEVLSEGFDRSKPVYEFQKAIALKQLENEKKAEKSAKEEKAVILCDRGMMDCRVYLDNSDFDKIKTELNLSDIDLRDRYDAVFHLDSTSTDKKIQYKNGEIRIESREEAEKINERSLKAWCGNPHYRFIPVRDSFDEKFELLLREVKAFLGIPKPLEIERKFLIKYPDLKYLKSQICSAVHIEQYYLLGKNGRFRVRRRGTDDSAIFILTVKNKISETVREEVEERITEEEYLSYIKNSLQIGKIVKDRYCLMYNEKYFEIDIFPFWNKQAYLEIELLSEDEKFTLPEFITTIREVTFDPAYKNSSLCKIIPNED